jgi:hypothetical protein
MVPLGPVPAKISISLANGEWFQLTGLSTKTGIGRSVFVWYSA